MEHIKSKLDLSDIRLMALSLIERGLGAQTTNRELVAMLRFQTDEEITA